MFPGCKLAAKAVNLEGHNGWSLRAPREWDAMKIGLGILNTEQPTTANIIYEERQEKTAKHTNNSL